MREESWIFPYTCKNALETALAACLEGIALTLEWSEAPFILETNCMVAANMIMQTEQDLSPDAATVEEIKHLLFMNREHVISLVRHHSNSVAHSLAQLG